MSVTANTDALLNLARSRAPADRERLLLAVVDLCGASDKTQLSSAPIQAQLQSIFMNLVVEAEWDIRRRLSEKLASATWAPSALVSVLAFDDIEIARPIIAVSPVLKDQDLVRLVLEATIEHQIEVARRPRIGRPVVAAILQQSEPAVLTALAGNETAEVGPDELSEMVKASERIAAMRSLLARHPALTDGLARELYVWVGQALRQSLIGRFRLDADALDAAIGLAVQEAHGGVPVDTDDIVAEARTSARDEMEQRLVAKLNMSGQLSPGYLLRALKDRNLSLFIAGLAMLGRFEPEQVERAVNSDHPELLALACASVGIDRSVFPTLLTLVRDLNAGRPGGGPEGARRANGAFGPFNPDVAGAAFRYALIG